MATGTWVKVRGEEEEREVHIHMTRVIEGAGRKSEEVSKNGGVTGRTFL